MRSWFVLLHNIIASLLFGSELVECDFVQCVCSSVGCCSVFSVSMWEVYSVLCNSVQCFNVSMWELDMQQSVSLFGVGLLLAGRSRGSWFWLILPFSRPDTPTIKAGRLLPDSFFVVQIENPFYFLDIFSCTGSSVSILGQWLSVRRTLSQRSRTNKI